MTSNQKSTFILNAAFPPKEKPISSSQIKCALDLAVCTDDVHLLLDRSNGLIRGELFRGHPILNPELIIGARAGITFSDKETIYVATGETLDLLLTNLSDNYISTTEGNLPKIYFEREEVLNRFLLNQPYARISISPCRTYNHASAPRGVNEVWVGGNVECYSRSSRGGIYPNLETFFNRGATPFLSDLH